MVQFSSPPGPAPQPKPSTAAARAARIEVALGTLAAAWVRRVCDRPGVVLAVALVVMLAAGGLALGRLGISTDTSAMLSPELPFQKAHARFLAAFPHLGNDLIVVVDGQTPALAERAARRLTAALQTRPDVIAEAADLQDLPFFRQNGLLYLPLDRLDRLAQSLTRAQPVIAGLWADPSLRGLATVMDLALGETATPGVAAPPPTGDSTNGPRPGASAGLALAPVLEAMAEVTRATTDGRSAHMAWSAVLDLPGVEAGTGPSSRRFILVKPVLDHASLAPAAAAMTAIRALADRLDLRPSQGVTVRLTGSAALDQEELASVQAGMDLAGAVTLVLVSVLLAVGLGSGRLILATLATLAAGLIATAGFAALAVGTLNLISVAFAVLFIGLSVDFGIHYGLRYREARAQGLANRLALDAAARGVGAALILSALAAAIAFLAFLPTAYRGLAQLGLIAGGGMILALIANLSILPALLTLLPARGPRSGSADGPAPSGAALPAPDRRGTGGLARLPRRFPRATLLVTVGVTAAALALVPQVRFDVDPLSLKDPGTESVSTLFDIMGDPGIDPYSIDVLAPSLAEAARLTEALSALPEVAGVASLPALVPDDQDAKLMVIEDLAFVLGPSLAVSPADPPEAAALVAARDRLARRMATVAQGSGPVAQAAGHFAAALAILPADAGLLAALNTRLMDGLTDHLTRIRNALDAQPITPDGIPPALARRYLSADGQARLEVFPATPSRDPAALRDFVAAVRGIAPEATGAPVLIQEAGRTILTAFAQAATIAFGLITIMLAVVLRSLRAVVLVFVPVILAGVLTLGASVVIGQPFNLANVIVLPLMVGLGVAGGIHVVSRSRQEANPGAALDNSTPRAVVFSALTTMGSFGSIALSSHPGTASMGVLLTVAITLGLICTLGVLPALLALWPEPGRPPLSPHPGGEEDTVGTDSDGLTPLPHP